MLSVVKRGTTGRLPSSRARRAPASVGARLGAELASAGGALEVLRALEAACRRSQAVEGVQVVENLYNYLGIISFKPGRIDPALVAALGATSYGFDCAMLVIPNRRVRDEVQPRADTLRRE